MEFVPVLAMLALVKKLIDFFKYATNKDTNGMLTTGLSWVAGIAAVLLYSKSDFASGIDIGGNLANMNIYSLIAIGLSVGSGAGLAADFLSAKRPSDDPARLKLLPSATKASARRRARSDEGAVDTRTLAWIGVTIAVIVLLIIIF